MAAVATPVPNNGDVVSVVASPMARDVFPVKGDGERESVFQRRSMEEMMEPLTAVYVSQQLSFIEAGCQCCAQRNMYHFHAGVDESAPLFLTGKEKSPCLTRCCCNPIHSQFIELSDTSNNVLYTVERQGCCTARPGLCCACPCTDSCTQEITLHEGMLEGEPGEVTNPHPLYTVTQTRSCEGGACTPELKLIPRAVGDKGAEEMNIVGPSCFGGCSELCFASQFNAMKASGKDAGFIKKEVPRDCWKVLLACCTDIDKYSVNFAESDTPQEKTAILSGAMLVDMMFFERDNGACRCTEESIYCQCCNMYCFGCLMPCFVCVPNPLVCLKGG